MLSMYFNMYTIILEMKKENDIERPLKGPDNDFRKMIIIGLGLIGGVSGLGGLLAAKEQDEEDEIDINNRGEGMDF